MRFWTLVFYHHSMLYGQDIPCGKGFFQALFFYLAIPFFRWYSYAEHSHTVCIRTLSIRLQIVGVCSAYAYELYAYAQHTHTKKHIDIYIDHTRMLSIRLWILCVCWAYAYNNDTYAEHQHTIRKRMLSICIWRKKYTEHTSRKSPHIRPPKSMENIE